MGGPEVNYVYIVITALFYLPLVLYFSKCLESTVEPFLRIHPEGKPTPLESPHIWHIRVGLNGVLLVILNICELICVLLITDTTNAVIKSSTGGQHQSQSIASPPDRSEVTRSEFTNHIQPDAHQRSDVTNQILPDTQPSSDVTNQNQPDTEQRSEITNQNQPDTEQRSEVTNQNQPNSQQSPEVTSSSIDGTNDVLIECSNLQNQELAVNR